MILVGAETAAIGTYSQYSLQESHVNGLFFKRLVSNRTTKEISPLRLRLTELTVIDFEKEIKEFK